MRNNSSDNSFPKEEDPKSNENTFIRCKNCESIIMDFSCLERFSISFKPEKTVFNVKLRKFEEKEKKLFHEIIVEEKKVQCKNCKLKIGNFNKSTLTCILINEKIYEEKFYFPKEKFRKDIVLVKQYDLQMEERLRASSNLVNYLKKINKNCLTEEFYEISAEMISIHEKIDKLQKFG
jgi:hypothetical protein